MPPREALHALRNRLLASPRFRRLAAAFPFTRPLARRRARALFDLCAGFVYSQVLLACVRLGLIERLAARPATAAELAGELGLGQEACARLLDAATALRLVERRGGGRYALGDLGAVLAGLPEVRAMVEHHALLYRDLQDPEALLRAGGGTGALAQYWPYAGAAEPAGLADGAVARYSALMSASLPLIGEELLAVYPLRRHRRLLDVGGGEGGFLLAAARRWPQLEGVLVDLPAVARRAEGRFREAGLGGRLQAVGADFRRDPLPPGADVACLLRVLHDHDDATVLGLLRAVHRSLPAGGTLVVAEPMASTRGCEPVAEAYFGLYLLAMGRGRPRGPDEIGALLRRAGFGRVRLHPARNPLHGRVLSARRG